MIQSVTIRISRCLPRYFRGMSTGGSVNDQSTMSEAYHTLGFSKTPTSAPALTLPSSSSSSSLPSAMEIPLAEDPLLHYFSSRLLKHGHRAKSSRITSRILLYIHAYTRAPPLPILQKAVLKAAPAVRTLTHRHGGKSVFKPVALGEKQRTRFAVKAILKASKMQNGRSVEERLARELIAVVRGKSEALKLKKEIHQAAMVNRGNAQTRI